MRLPCTRPARGQQRTQGRVGQGVQRHDVEQPASLPVRVRVRVRVRVSASASEVKALHYSPGIYAWIPRLHTATQVVTFRFKVRLLTERCCFTYHFAPALHVNVLPGCQ